MTKQATPELPDSVRFDTFNDYVAVRYGNPRGYRLVGVIVKDSLSGWRLDLLEGSSDFPRNGDLIWMLRSARSFRP